VGAVFSAAREDRDRRKGRYNWLPPEGMHLVHLIENVRNSKPIASTVGHFLAQQESIASVAGPKPEVIVCPRQKLIETTLTRVKRLLTQERFGANQLLGVAVDFDKEDLLRAANRFSIEVVDVTGVFRFPLPPTDLRVAIGSPDDVQGLEAEVVVVMLAGGREMAPGLVRDLYVAASRARSHLILVTQQPLDQLQLAARAALTRAADEH
jgi:hypothetical protein